MHSKHSKRKLLAITLNIKIKVGESLLEEEISKELEDYIKLYYITVYGIREKAISRERNEYIDIFNPNKVLSKPNFSKKQLLRIIEIKFNIAEPELAILAARYIRNIYLKHIDKFSENLNVV